ncbi:hypothetical protein [Haloferula sp. BvORR071]|uniref:hypothetical protein n=1 Tax=Haloferula sp. BvORR071 TaxID=1396141 RepID=UPI000558C0C7|nr:hypothetical protein [Haloferula sp. BvORR071]
MKTILSFIAIATLASFTSCTYVEPTPTAGPTSTTRDTTTTATDYNTGESVTTHKRTTHYPAE